MTIDFNIVENAPDFESELYERFIQLYNSDIPVKKIYKKLDITPRRYCKIRKKAIQEGRVQSRKPAVNKNNQKNCKRVVKNYTYSTIKNAFIVKKSINGKEIYYGSYKKEKDAQQIVDELKKANWDKNELPRIKEEVLKTWQLNFLMLMTS